MIPIHALVLILTGLLSPRLYILPTLVDTQLVPCLGASASRLFSSREDVGAYGCPGFLQLVAFADRTFSQSRSSSCCELLWSELVRQYRRNRCLDDERVYLISSDLALGTAQPLRRCPSINLLHGPGFFAELHNLVIIISACVLICFKNLRDAHAFVVVYFIRASFFAGVTVYLMLM